MMKGEDQFRKKYRLREAKNCSVAEPEQQGAELLAGAGI
jgi:hypothetical protein